MAGKVVWPEKLALDAKVQLSSGANMPVFGLGTWLSAKGKTGEAVKVAVQNGYVHVDCASIYFNEDEVGEAFAELFGTKEAPGKFKREDVWVTSKLWNDCHRKEHIKEHCLQTLKDLQLEYLDLYLIHFPVSFKHGIKEAMSATQMDDVPLEETWAGMEELVAEGLVKNIGISNFEIPDVERILKCAKIRPVVNQYETQPQHTRQPLVDFCQKEGIVVTAHTSLGSPANPWAHTMKPLMENELVKEIAASKAVAVSAEEGKRQAGTKSTAHVLLRWGLQRQTIVIPKSITPERILSNTQVFDFELSQEEMEKMNGLNADQPFNHPTTPWLGRGPFPDDVEKKE